MSKATKPSDVRARSEDQLKDEVLSLRREQMNLRFQRANGQMENASRSRAIRKAIAQIKTIQSERRLVNQESK